MHPTVAAFWQAGPLSLGSCSSVSPICSSILMFSSTGSGLSGSGANGVSGREGRGAGEAAVEEDELLAPEPEEAQPNTSIDVLCLFTVSCSH